MKHFFNMAMAATIICAATENRKVYSGEPVSNQVAFRITKVEDSEVITFDITQNPFVKVKWLITTELTNESQADFLLKKIPYFGATMKQKPEMNVFTGGSNLPLVSEKHDFWRVPKGGVIRSWHVVFASRKPGDENYQISGYCLKSEQVIEGKEGKEYSREGYPKEWWLKEGVSGEFGLAITLFDWVPDEAEKILGKSFSKLWKGKVMTSHTKIKISPQ